MMLSTPSQTVFFLTYHIHKACFSSKLKAPTRFEKHKKTHILFWSVALYQLTRMWANAQRDGRPAEYRWRPLFNAAKFG